MYFFALKSLADLIIQNKIQKGHDDPSTIMSVKYKVEYIQNIVGGDLCAASLMT